MKLSKILSVLLLDVLVILPCLFANTYVSEPFGQIKLTVNGTNGAGSSAVTVSGATVLGAPLENEIEAAGSLTSVAGTTLTSSPATWTPGVFAATHYVQITSGTYTGISATIVNNTATELITSEDRSPLLNGGESFVVRAYTTLADVFGAFNEAGLGSGPNAGVADVVLIYNGTLLKIIKLSS